MNIKQFISQNKKEILEVFSKTISYNTVENHDDSNYPFGKGNADCLNYVLSECEKFGMQIKNLDNYSGFGEYGGGGKLVGVIGHLDTVPYGDGWISEPTVLTERNGKLFGRGTIDDKGPMVASMFAIKYLIENKKDWNNRLRIVFGSNEESGSKCLEHYVKKEGHVDIGFTPDGPFPCCFGEKGILGFTASAENTFFKSLSGGLVGNAVPAKFEATFSQADLSLTKLENYFKTNSIKYELSLNDDDVKLVTYGVAAHASTPEKGVNAISHSLVALKEAGVKDPAIIEMATKLNTEINGKSLGIAVSDQYGDLTINAGIIKLEKNIITIYFDVRCPFTYELEDLKVRLNNPLNCWKTKILSSMDGIYVPEDSEFVQMLTKASNEILGVNDKPVTMGGGTYARGINNIIAFGPSIKDEDNHMHDANEFIREDHFFKLIEIYAAVLDKML